MSLKHKRTKTQPNSQIKLNLHQINTIQNPQQYLLNLLTKSCAINKINTQKMSIKQLSILMSQLCIVLKNKQLHQLYLYATYQYNKEKTTENKISSVVNIEINNINLPSVTKWILRRAKKNKIQIMHNQDQTGNKQRQKKYHHSQSFDSKQLSKYKLPQIKNKSPNMFTNEVGKVLSLFSEIQKQRQNAGLQAVCISDQQQEDRTQPVKQLCYQGDFFQVNQRISTLRQQARCRIQKVIDATKHDKKLKLKFQQALMRYQRIRNQANQKMGRCGAMKAQKRIFDKQKIQIKNLQRWTQRTNQTSLKTKYY